MTEQQALERLAKQRRFHASSSLQWMRALMERLGNPQDKLRYVHVTGTNGKGSTCTMLASVLREAGFCTGLFLSPYIETFRERMQVNGTMIPAEDLVSLVERIDPVVRQMEQEGMEVTEFEFVTALAFCWFVQQECDVVVLEVGVGGRYDSTNVIPTPLAAVITPISLDHTALLGESVAAIAREKGGIIKPGCVTVVAPHQPPEALAVLQEIARENGSRLRVAEDSGIVVEADTLEGLSLNVKGMPCFLPLCGHHQVENAATALAVLDELQRMGWDISSEQLRGGMAAVRFPARLEVLGKEPFVLLDGAHNAGGLRVLRAALQQYLPGKRLVALTGMMADKDCACAPQVLAGLFMDVVTVTPSHPRALDAESLARLWQGACPKVHPADDCAQAVRLARSLAGKDGAVAAFGSLLLAGELRPLLLENGMAFPSNGRKF